MSATSLRTTDVLLHMVVTLLAPMFLTTTGDVDQAHAAALATVRSCTARNPMDLLLIAQMIAFGLATLNSVSLSMEDDIPINLILRLRGNAVSLHRASDKCRQALADPDPTAACDAPLTDAEREHEANVIAEAASTQKRVAEYRASFAQPRPAPSQTASTPAPTGAPSTSDKIMRAASSAAFPDPKQQVRDNLARQTQPEPPAFSMRAAALGTTASHLLSGTSPPPR